VPAKLLAVFGAQHASLPRRSHPQQGAWCTGLGPPPPLHTRTQETYDVYVNDPKPLAAGEEKRIISVFVADESGMINRVAGVFARRSGCGAVGGGCVCVLGHLRLVGRSVVYFRGGWVVAGVGVGPVVRAHHPHALLGQRVHRHAHDGTPASHSSR